MNRRVLAIVALLTLLAIGSAGCANSARRSSAAAARPRTYALAVTVNRVLQPTPAQFAAIQAKVAKELAAQGLVLVTDLALADRILRIDFTPDPNDPENSGRAQLLGVRSNPYHASLASTSSIGRYPTSFGYLGSFQNTTWGYGGFSNYYGYSSSYYDGYTYCSANLNPVIPPVTSKPANPPHRHDPANRDHCPPPSDTYIRPLPVRLNGDYASQPINDHPRSAPPDGRGRWRDSGGSISGPTFASTDGGSSRPGRGSWRSDSDTPRSERINWRSDSSGSRPERTYSRSDSGGWRSERSRSDSGSYSRSESSSSSPSYSSSSYDSSSSSSSSFSSGSSFSSPSASPSPAPATDVAANKNLN